MSDPDEVQRLIRLKRYENPGEGYYEAFVENFKDRQRSEMLRSSSRDLLFERVSMWLGESGGTRYAPVGVGALAAVALGAGIYWLSTGRNEDAVAGPSATVAAVSEVKADEAGEGGKIEEVIRLKLPRANPKAPELNEAGGSEGLMNVGAKGRFREL